MDHDLQHPPRHDGPPVSPRHAGVWAGLAWACAVGSFLLVGYGILLGIVGMVLGSGAHLKGHRAGMPAAVVSGVGTVAAMAIVFFLRQ